MLRDVRHPPRLEARLAVGRRIQAALQVEIGAGEPHTGQLPDPRHRRQPLGPPHGIRGLDRRDRARSPHVAVVVNEREALCSLLRLMAGIAQAGTTGCGHGVGASAMPDAPSAVVRVRERRHAGEARVFTCAVVGPPGTDVVNRRLVDCRLAGAVLTPGSTRPRPPGVEHPYAQVEAPVRAECALGSAPGERQVWPATCMALSCGAVDGHRRTGGLCWRGGPHELASCDDGYARHWGTVSLHVLRCEAHP
jgi:hypothetical protein